jgi:hypothetical protein
VASAADHAAARAPRTALTGGGGITLWTWRSPAKAKGRASPRRRLTFRLDLAGGRKARTSVSGQASSPALECNAMYDAKLCGRSGTTLQHGTGGSRCFL